MPKKQSRTADVLRSSPATLQDVADAAGVSLATASRAINGGARTVPLEVHDRVLVAAMHLSYVPHGPAQALARSTTSTVGMIVHDMSDPYYSAIAGGATRVAYKQDLLVLLADTFGHPDLVFDYVHRLRGERAKAVLLLGSGFQSQQYQEEIAQAADVLTAGGIALVCVGEHEDVADTVQPDNADGAKQVAEYLRALGHTEIGVITGPDELMVSKVRLDAFRESMRTAGIGSIPSRAVSGHFTREGGRVAALELMRGVPSTTAIFALNDLMAVGALTALRDDLGLKVPDDVSVVGFDDISVATDVTPQLTTVHLSLDEIGASAMGLALKPGSDDVRRIIRMPAQLVIRGSTGKPR